MVTTINTTTSTPASAGVEVVRHGWQAHSGRDWAWMGIKAEVAVSEFLRIAERDGTLTPDAVVDDSRPASAPLHSAFEWNDKIAATAHRIEQANMLIRGVVTIYRNAETQEELPPVRMMVKLLPPEEQDDFDQLSDEMKEATQKNRYITVTAALSEPIARRQMVERALKDLNSWRRRYAHLVELSDLFATLDTITLPDLASVAD